MTGRRTGARQPLSGRVAVVTGAARGLGACLARALVRRGATVALVGLEAAALERLARSYPGRAYGWSVDVTDRDALAECADDVQRRLGPPSVLVANAGVVAGSPFLQSDPDVWRRVVDVNLVGSAQTVRAFLPGLLATRGYYLQIASLAALTPVPMMSAYCASKAGAEAFAHAVRAEVSPRGVDVGIAYLSWADTDMIHAPVLRELRAHLPWPMGKVYPPQPVADRLVRGVERRATILYGQPWVRAAQVVRAGLPGLATRLFRTAMPVLESRGDLAAPGLIGAGGRADDAARSAARRRKGA
ncbi:SDR family oxidoreductase [Streptomyces sp. NPDC048506]|uniref:SDR family oxidoreductase n=1 Tax=Streptomyces sp. NPDC048506 TaxID=3155028 RepID=UPI00341E2BA9